MNDAHLAVIRQYPVVKSNTLIQKTRYDLTTREQKILMRIIQMIKPDDTSFKPYLFDIKEFCGLCGITSRSGKNFEAIKSALKSLSDKSFWIKEDGDTKETLVRWIVSPTIYKNSGVVEVQLDEKLKPYLLQLKDYFTSYSFENVAYMKSKYSLRVYELLKSYENLHIIRIQLDTLRTNLSIEPTYTWTDINRRVLQTATNEINKVSDLYVSYTPIKEKGKEKVTAVEFKIMRNKRELDTIEDITEYEQLGLE